MYAKFNAFIATATFLSLLACGQIQEEASTLASLTGDDYHGQYRESGGFAPCYPIICCGLRFDPFHRIATLDQRIPQSMEITLWK